MVDRLVMGYAIHFKDGERCNEEHKESGKLCFLPSFHSGYHVAWDGAKALIWDKVIVPPKKVTMQDMLNGNY